jgi:hypothetical protein
MIVADAWMNLLLDSALENFIRNFDDTKLPFIKWALWKLFVFTYTSLSIFLVAVLSVIAAAIAGWIIFPIHFLLNISKYNPIAIWKEQYKPREDDK